MCGSMGARWMQVTATEELDADRRQANASTMLVYVRVRAWSMSLPQLMHAEMLGLPEKLTCVHGHTSAPIGSVDDIVSRAPVITTSSSTSPRSFRQLAFSKRLLGQYSLPFHVASSVFTFLVSALLDHHSQLHSRLAGPPQRKMLIRIAQLALLLCFALLVLGAEDYYKVSPVYNYLLPVAMSSTIQVKFGH